MKLKHLPNTSIDLIAQIDRSEHVDYAYEVRDGALERISVDWNVPTFHPEGTGPHTVHSQVTHGRGVLRNGGELLGAFDGEALAGLAIIVPEFEPPMAQLAYMHVSRPYRRRGVGSLLWNEAESIARARHATSMYVSAIPSGPTIDFYVGHGCRPVAEPHPLLFEKEPEDLHLIKPLD